MNIRRSMTLVLPFLLTSSVALAQQTSGSGTTGEQQSQHNKSQQNQKRKAADQQKQRGDQKGDDKGVPKGSTEILGQEVQNQDDDLDVKVGKARTTAAEPARPDVVESRAEEVREVEGRRVNIAPLFGYGTGGYNVGIGARAGYTFDRNPVYVGGTFMYHFGESQSSAFAPILVETSTRLFYPGVEVGYDIGLGPVLVRPYGGVGLLFGRTSVTANNQSATNTENALMIYPGVTAQYLFPRSPFFVGGDSRVLIPFTNQNGSFNLIATAGLRM